MLRYRADFYRQSNAGPDAVMMLVEVADTTLTYDRDVKLQLYARHGIPEVWLVDLNGHLIIVCRKPGPHGYNDVSEVRGADRVSPLGFPDLSLTVDEIVGEAH